MSTTTGIGEVKPGPKPSLPDSRSYAWRVVCCFGAVLESARPRRTLSTGKARMNSTTRTAGSTNLALRVTNRPHRGDQRPGLALA